MSRRKLYWVCQFSGWILYTSIIVLLMRIFIGDRSEPWAQLKYQLAAWGGTFAIGFLVTHLYRIYIKMNKWVSFSLRSLVVRIFVACFILAIIWEISALVFLFSSGLFPISGMKPEYIFIGALPYIFFWCIVLLTWSLLYFGFHYAVNYRRSEIEKLQLESVAKEAELNVLKSQMNPHFIFNCLNSIRALIIEDPGRAQSMITQLANIMRYSLQLRSKATVTLKEEMGIVADYLALEAIRLEDRLNIDWNIDKETLNIPIPTLLIQTLVENSIKYGIATRPEGGEIRLSSHLQDSFLHLQVINTGQLSNTTNSTGIGLRNATERLKLLFGEAANLELKMNTEDQVAAYIKIPLQ